MPVQNQRDASRKFRELIAADRIAPVPHAKTQMWNRGISIEQVRRILKGGSVIQRPYQTTSGYWRSEYAGYFAGDYVQVVAELQEGDVEMCLVITAMN